MIPTARKRGARAAAAAMDIGARTAIAPTSVTYRKTVSVRGPTLKAGAFRLQNVPVGADRLTVRFVGFQTTQREVCVHPGELVYVDIVLEAGTVLLDGVVVTATAAGVFGPRSRQPFMPSTSGTWTVRQARSSVRNHEPAAERLGEHDAARLT